MNILKIVLINSSHNVDAIHSALWTSLVNIKDWLLFSSWCLKIVLFLHYGWSKNFCIDFIRFRRPKYESDLSYSPNKKHSWISNTIPIRSKTQQNHQGKQNLKTLNGFKQKGKITNKMLSYKGFCFIQSKLTISNHKYMAHSAFRTQKAQWVSTSVIIRG